MPLGKSKNRRRVDTAQRKAVVQGAVQAHGRSALKLFWVIAFTVAVGWGGFAAQRWARSAPVFGLRRTLITGNTRASRQELIKLSGLGLGQNLFSLDLRALERALSAHPWVRRVELERHFPNALAIEVVEHVPSAMVVLGDLYVVDEEGEPFKRLVPQDGLDLPLITGIDREAYVKDESAARQRFLSALDVAKQYAASHPGRRERLSELRLDSGGVSLMTAQGLEIRLGEGALEDKLARLSRVRRELSARGLQAERIHLDNRARPGWVAVKLSSPVSEKSGRSAQ